jgi:hypothetical protein
MTDKRQGITENLETDFQKWTMDTHEIIIKRIQIRDEFVYNTVLIKILEFKAWFLLADSA